MYLLEPNALFQNELNGSGSRVGCRQIAQKLQNQGITMSRLNLKISMLYLLDYISMKEHLMTQRCLSF